MIENDMLAELSEIFTDVIDEGKVHLTMQTTADEVEGWDSLNHIQILAAIEKKYGFRFTLNEIHAFKNVGDLVHGIQKKLG